VRNATKTCSQGIIYPISPKIFDTTPTPAPNGGVKSSYTPDGVHVILS